MWFNGKDTGIESGKDMIKEHRAMTQLKAPKNLTAPCAKMKPHSFTHHGITVSDPYHWLKDPKYPTVDDPDVLNYLHEENAYFKAVMAPHEKLTKTFFAEIKGRIKEDDHAVPWDKNGYRYSWHFEKGAQYRCWTRRKNGDEIILLDEEKEADGKEFYRLSSLEVSPDNALMAWSVDDSGGERFTIRVKNIESGDLLTDEILESSGSIIWTKDSKAFFYVVVSAEWRPYCVMLHRLGTDTAKDVMIYEEADSSFFTGIGLTSSEEFILIRSADHVTAEVYALPADNPTAAPTLIAERITGRDIYVDHGQDQFFMRLNDTDKDFRIVTAPTATPSKTHWREIKAGGAGHYYRGLQVFKNYLVIEDRVDGLDQIIIRSADGTEHLVRWPEDAYAVGLGNNPNYNQAEIRLNYESMVTPLSVFDYSPDTKDHVLMKEQEIPCGYDKSQYETKRLQVKARDGALVPVSIVYRKGFKLGSDAPMHLYGYGAYGLGMDPSFSAARLSLLDRGFAYAIAHIRGGDEMGYGWYDAGKLFNRTNTFNDFVDCAEHLTREGYVKKGNISISGGSAGGELMGAAANMAPSLFAGIIMHVPFVDVLNTMLDDTLPLTPIEWPEWGNPIESEQAFKYIQSYSPYDQIETKNYPPMLVTGGLNDPRVTYWEPAKWTAKLRATKTDDNLMTMKINMGAGHGGKSGRYERIEEKAEEYCFMMMAHSMADIT